MHISCGRASICVTRGRRARFRIRRSRAPPGRYHSSHTIVAIAARTAPACSRSTSDAGRGARGNHLAANTAQIGTCRRIRNLPARHLQRTGLSYHRLTEVLPMFPDTSVTPHPGCSLDGRRVSRDLFTPRGSVSCSRTQPASTRASERYAPRIPRTSSASSPRSGPKSQAVARHRMTMSAT